ncbi:ATP-binding protein [Pseudoroseicyclus sp. H15]
MPTIRRYTDFSEIEVLSTAPAVVMAAVYARGMEAVGEVPPAVNIPNWSVASFKTLFEIGFFEIVGHGPAERVQEVYRKKDAPSYKVSKILSAQNADGLEEASAVVAELLEFLSFDEEGAEDLLTEINTAVGEAMINVAKHAYPEWYTDGRAEVCLKQWWMSARADKENNTLTIVIYDQGATIPGTLPRRDWYKEAVTAVMKSLVGEFDYESAPRMVDHEYINYSMKRGKTQTGASERGLGLPQMQELIDLCEDGTLSIISRKGLYKYGKDVGAFKRPLSLDLEGTLIEWEITLPRTRRHGD